MNNANLKETYPQKYYFRIACNALFYLGFAAGTIDKLLAYLRTDLTEKAKSEILQVACTEVPIVLIFYILMLKRQPVRDVLKNLLERNREIFTCTELEVQDVKKAKILLYVFFMGTYAYMTLFTAQKVVFCYIEGVPIETHVTYFPTNARTGYFYVLCQILVVLQFWVLVTTILAADCLCIMALLFVRSKFKQTQVYFEMFRENPQILNDFETFKKSVLIGIKLHEDALWCARNVQSSLGHIYGIHICMTILLLAISLLKFAVSEQTLVNFAVNMLHFALLIVFIGCYMIISGDITHEAARVAPAVFHCGWERVRGVRSVRHVRSVRDVRSVRSLLVVAIHRAQQPVYMTAFGFLVLSHENFISVLRSAYSFSALVY